MKAILSIFFALLSMANASLLDEIDITVDVSALEVKIIIPSETSTSVDYGRWISWEKPAFTAGVRVYVSDTEVGPYSFLIDMGNKKWFFVETQENQIKFIKGQAYNTLGLESPLSQSYQISPKKQINVNVTPTKVLALNHDGSSSFWSGEMLVSDDLRNWHKMFQHVLHNGIYKVSPQIYSKLFFRLDPEWEPYYGYGSPVLQPLSAPTGFKLNQ